ncbi:MAG: DUF6152 family protein [Pseudomonadota bacterium]
MKTTLSVLALFTIGLGTAQAHHSFAMFDTDKVVTWEGTVERFDWSNPHLHLIVAVPAAGKDAASAGKWDFEGASPNIASRQGWNKLSFKKGDKIKVTGNPMRDGSKGGSLKFALTADGKVLYHDLDRKVTPDTAK